MSQVREFICQTINSDVEIYYDAGSRPRIIPPDIVATSNRPDLAIIKRKAKTVILFELTVLYQKNVQKDHPYKYYKYAHLAMDLLNIGFKVKFYTIEIDCRELISMENSNRR